VDVHFTHVARITPTSVVGGDGIDRKVDTIVCATGFDVSFKPRFPIIGANGVSLEEKWQSAPQGYLGLAVPDMPNFISFASPASPIENGSAIGPMQAVGDYAIQVIMKMQSENIMSFMPKQRVTDDFNRHCQEFLREAVWSDTCRSWYKRNETGEIYSVYPGSSLHYIELVTRPRWEDFVIEYGDAENMWSFMGRGFALAQLSGGDLSPYLDEENIDAKWIEAIQK
jgi:hydroxyversicolorone monooxygenase